MKFVVIAGDLGDGEGIGTSKAAVALNSLGLLPPTSPYIRGGEFLQLSDEFARFSKPVFAVPGNHDGYANYGGTPTQWLNYVASSLKAYPITSILGYGLAAIARQMPVFFKFGPAWAIVPFSDGLVDWSYVLACIIHHATPGT